MSNYQRFLTYIHAYEGETKGKNVGFAKVEIRGDLWRAEIRLKGSSLQETVTIFAIQPEGESTTMRQLGQMKMAGGGGSFCFTGKYEETGAFLLKDEKENVCYSEWKSMPRGLKTEEAETVEMESVTNDETASGTGEEKETAPLWKLLQKVCPKRLPAPGFEMWELLEIQLEDIGRLPRENWVYGNNSFLVQGYYRYRHLLLAARGIENGVRYCLCVPGMKNETEEMVAGLFGFQEFMPSSRGKDALFGYWCVEISL